ncbi:MAG: D-2-hydroxyacid dehydrogenase [Rhodospirillaceae bacterium]|nr:MAG: D-2-hydroxyacid dehydrogenase [Rhodospirillaceae bacterium]
MVRLLIYQRTYLRISNRLSDLAGVAFIVFNDDGTLNIDGRAIESKDAKPDAAWFALDLYAAPARKAFLKLLLNVPTLQWVQLPGAGVEHPDYVELFTHGLRLTTSHGHAASIAEYVLAGVLDHFQRGPERRTAQANRVWRPIFFREVSGSNWLVVGFGAIGQGVAARARAFGAKITAVRRDLSPHALADSLAPMSDLLNLLPQADVVVLCLPLNAGTANLVNEPFLAAMKAGSVLVNVGRGGLVDETALLTALDAGKPEHAVLDVFQTEPLPGQSPFWSHPRVALTSHGASVTNNLYPRADDIFFENLQRFLTGRALLHEVSALDFGA